MTNYDAMTDRELDAAVAEKVMGWKWHLCHELNELGEMVYHFRNDEPPAWWKRPTEVERPILPQVSGVRTFVDLGTPFYSTDIAAAWEVIDAAKALGVSFDVHEPSKGKRCALSFVGDTSFRVVHDNPARAICLAALRAVEAKEDRQ